MAAGAGEEYVPAQVRAPETIDLRAIKLGPKGYKERSKRKLEEMEKQAVADAEMVAEAMQEDGPQGEGQEEEDHQPSGKRQKANDSTYRPVGVAPLHVGAHAAWGVCAVRLWGTGAGGGVDADGGCGQLLLRAPAVQGHGGASAAAPLTAAVSATAAAAAAAWGLGVWPPPSALRRYLARCGRAWPRGRPSS